LPLAEFLELSGRAATVLKLKEGVELQRVVACHEDQELVVASSTGRMLRLAINETNLPVMGRIAQGPTLMRLLPGEQVVGAATSESSGDVVLASRLGQLKRLALESLRQCQRGDLGQIGLRFLDRSDELVDLQGPGATMMGVVLAGGNGRSLRLKVADVPLEDTSGSGLNLGLAPGQQVQELIPLLMGES
jgi:DNA gyrase subunit A